MKKNYSMLCLLILCCGCAATSTSVPEKEPTQIINPQNEATEKDAPPVYSIPKNIDSGINELAQGLLTGIPQGKNKKIAILEFIYENEITELGRHMAEELGIEFTAKGSFQVIERRDLYRVIKEQNISLNELFDSSNAKRVGKLAGADAILTGNITDRIESLRVNAKLVDTETGVNLAAARTTLIKNEVVDKLLLKEIKIGWTPLKPPVGEQDNTEDEKEKHQLEPGLIGEYFNLTPNSPSIPFTPPVLERKDAVVNFDWKYGSPLPRIHSDWFGVRWTGLLHIDIQGTYSFKFVHDDGVRIWVNSEKIYDSWRGGVYDNSIDIHFEDTGWMPIKIEYWEGSALAKCLLFWAKPGAMEFEILPTSHLAHESE
jgi:TolB-like protein